MTDDERPDMSRRHHYVPRFYLNRFANQRDQVTGYRRSTGKLVERMSTRDAAVEIGFNDVTDAEGTISDAAEQLLAEIEATTAPAVNTLVESWPPERDVKGLVANFAALQAARTREHRHSNAAMMKGFTDIARQMLDEAGSDGIYFGDDFVRKDDLEGMANLDPTDAVFGMLEVASQLVQPFADRSWTLFRTKRRTFMTSDTPVISANANPSSHVGTGFLTADAVLLPMDPRHLLMMSPPLGMDAPKVLDIPPAMGRDMSGYIAWSSYDWTFSDPRSRVLREIELPAGPRPVGQIGGFGSSFRELWGPGHEPDDPT